MRFCQDVTVHVVGAEMGLKGAFWECLLLPAPTPGAFQTLNMELCYILLLYCKMWHLY